MTGEARLTGTVLYVEDEELTRTAVGASLGRRVEQLYLADNGRAGLEVFRERRPDIVITDIAMPEMTGLEMARQIRGLDADVPIVVTTAHTDTPNLLEAIEIGVDSYVPKPVDFRRLFSVVERNLAVVDHRRQAARHLEEQTRLLAELQESMRQVKLLSGLLPICAHCKKIRDDKGYWKQLEAYISDHSTVLFSHGVCPECLEVYYPDVAGDP